MSAQVERDSFAALRIDVALKAALTDEWQSFERLRARMGGEWKGHTLSKALRRAVRDGNARRRRVLGVEEWRAA